MIIYSNVVYHPYDKEQSLTLYTYNVLPKTNRGWKIVMPKAPPDSISEHHGKFFITVTRRGNNADYYVIVKHAGTLEKMIEIIDNRESSFNIFVEAEDDDIWWYTCVDSLDKNYELIIDGESIKLNNVDSF